MLFNLGKREMKQAAAQVRAEFAKSNLLGLLSDRAITLALAQVRSEALFKFSDEEPGEDQPDRLFRTGGSAPTFVGVVHEGWGRSPPGTKPVQASVKLTQGDVDRLHFSNFYLTAERDRSTPGFYHSQFKLWLYLRDYKEMIVNELREAFSDGAISNCQFIHATFGMEKMKPAEILAALEAEAVNVRGQVQVTLGRITAVRIVRDLALPKAPTWSWDWASDGHFND